MSEPSQIPPPQDPKMDIHKPKPWHNWREFLKELGTIALGVGVALAAEQTVEWLHWREQVAEAREAIASETTQNIAGSIRRMRTVQCTENRLDALARMGDFLAQIESAGELSVAKLMLVASQIQSLA